MAGKIGEQKVRCSFCNKSEDQVRKLIAGPDGVYICDECIEICDEILEEELEDEFNMTVDEEINLLKPEEIKAFLDDYVIGQDEAKKALIAEMIDDDAELVSIYYGADVSEEEAEKLANSLETEYEDIEFEVQYGGQPVYSYFVSVE